VAVLVMDTDRYGRLIAEVYAGEAWLSQKKNSGR
jgi:hypothetical protein